MSEIHFYCMFCGAGIDADYRHKVCECPKCRRFTPVPVAPGSTSPWAETYPHNMFSLEIKFPCPECGERLGVDARHAGRMGECPHCDKAIQCPHLPFLLVPAPAKMDASKTNASEPKEEAGTVIRLSREEIAFLSEPETSAGKVAHAS